MDKDAIRVKIDNLTHPDTENFRTRLMDIHQNKMDEYLRTGDGPILFDLEELKDISEFMSMFLYD